MSVSMNNIDKVFCEKCKYIKRTDEWACAHPNNVKIIYTPYTVILHCKSIYKFNKKNDCKLFEENKKTPPCGK
jgi:hypothetical protein